MSHLRAELRAVAAIPLWIPLALVAAATVGVVYWAASSPLLLAALLVPTLVVPLSLYLPLRWLTLLPFASVIWLGEGFHADGRLLLSPHVALAALVVFAALARGPLELVAALCRRRAMVVFLILLVASALIGVLGDAEMSVVKIDLSPLLYFVAAYAVAAARLRRLEDAAWITRGILLLTALALVKVIYLGTIVGGVADWENDWQALVEIGATPLDTRIILRGADLFWFVGAAVLLGRLQTTPGTAGKLRLLPMVAVLGIGMLFSATRSNWLGFGAGMLAQWLLALRLGLVSGRQLKRFGAALLLLALLVGIAESQPEYSLREKLRARLEKPGQELAMSIRMAEAQALVESVGWSVLLGRGLGSEYTYVDSLQGMVRSHWSHNGFLYLYLKAGLAGVAAYLVLFCAALRVVWRRATATADPHERATCLGLLGALVCTAVLSLAVNKIFAVSGALFCGLLLGTLLNLRPAAAPSDAAARS
jgi:hypothetical protein